MFRIAADIAANEGLFRLWQGLSPSLARHAVYSGVRISLYEKLRSILSGGQHRYRNNGTQSRISYFLHVWTPVQCPTTLTCAETQRQCEQSSASTFGQSGPAPPHIVRSDLWSHSPAFGVSNRPGQGQDADGGQTAHGGGRSRWDEGRVVEETQSYDRHCLGGDP